MDTNSIIGIILIITAVGLLCGLVWWSRRIINRIDTMGPRSARKILREFRQTEGEDTNG